MASKKLKLTEERLEPSDDDLIMEPVPENFATEEIRKLVAEIRAVLGETLEVNVPLFKQIKAEDLLPEVSDSDWVFQMRNRLETIVLILLNRPKEYYHLAKDGPFDHDFDELLLYLNLDTVKMVTINAANVRDYNKSLENLKAAIRKVPRDIAKMLTAHDDEQVQLLDRKLHTLTVLKENLEEVLASHRRPRR